MQLNEIQSSKSYLESCEADFHASHQSECDTPTLKYNFIQLKRKQNDKQKHPFQMSTDTFNDYLRVAIFSKRHVCVFGAQ